MQLAIDAYYGCMADFSHILMTRPDFGDDDREWLHQLVADWQVIADLSFADLLLIRRTARASTSLPSNAVRPRWRV